MQKLKKLNLIMSAAHGGQALLLLLLSSSFSRPITANYLVYNEATGTLQPATRQLFEFEFVYGVIVFSLLSALFHLLIATIFFKRYQRGLKAGINRFRWVEYSLSASVMMVLIAILSGVFDAGSLIMMFGLVAVMNLMGLSMEVHNQTTKKTNWLSFKIGTLAGALPWLVIALYFWASSTAPESVGGPPAFVYVIWATIFIFFSSFAVNMFLQYKKWGKWRDYLYGERVYIWLSLFAKSALVWQVYFGTLQP